MVRHPHSPRAAGEQIIRTLADNGHIAYFAGGCVRDELLGLAPSDYDVATDATPDRIGTLFPRTAAVGAHFGVMLVKIEDDVIEVATFRSDGSYTDSRRPDTVTFSDPASDAQRRDYTINALFLDPITHDRSPPIPGATIVDRPGHGRVIDYVGGLADIERRILRAVGDPDQRLAEDHLRALRAARLAAKLGMDLDPATAAAIRRHAADLRGVSRERIGEEVKRMAQHPSRATAAALIHSLSLETPVFIKDGDKGPRTWGVLSALPPEVAFATSLAAWLMDIGNVDWSALDPDITTWRRALMLSNEDRDLLLHILKAMPILTEAWPKLPVARQKRLSGSAWFGEALTLLKAWNPQTAANVTARVTELSATHGGLTPTPWVTGDDLVSMGLTPGPRFKVVLDGVYDAQLEGKVADRAQALELATRLGV